MEYKPYKRVYDDKLGLYYLDNWMMEYQNQHWFRNDEVPHVVDIVRFPTTFKPQEYNGKPIWHVLVGFDVVADTETNSKKLANNLLSRLYCCELFEEVHWQRLDHKTVRFFCFAHTARGRGER